MLCTLAVLEFELYTHSSADIWEHPGSYYSNFNTIGVAADFLTH